MKTAIKIEDLHGLPETALFTPVETTAYLNVRLDLLRAWRCQGRGPGFVGRGHFIRYPKRWLDEFIAGYSRPHTFGDPATRGDTNPPGGR